MNGKLSKEIWTFKIIIKTRAANKHFL